MVSANIDELVEDIMLFIRIDEHVKKRGYKVLMIDDFPHKDDFYLKAIICQKDSQYVCQYVCWIYNTNDNAVYDGYYTSSFDDAYLKLQERISSI